MWRFVPPPANDAASVVEVRPEVLCEVLRLFLGAQAQPSRESLQVLVLENRIHFTRIEHTGRIRVEAAFRVEETSQVCELAEQRRDSGECRSHEAAIGHAH